jgi:hypothetical protein
MLAHLSFLAPYWLGFLVVLPILWWLLRLTPPAPRKVTFPALMLLKGLAASEKTPAHTPWWVLLLRLLTAMLIIVAFASPVLDPQASLPGKGALLIVVDNDWAAAAKWDERQTALHDLIRQAARENRKVILVPTALDASGAPLALIGPVAAASAYGEVERIVPEPWPADRTQVVDLLKKLDRSTIADAVWLASGTGGNDTKNLYAELQDNGGVRVLADKNAPLYLLDFTTSDDAGERLRPDEGVAQSETDIGASEIAVMRGDTGEQVLSSVAAIGKDGDVLAHLPIAFAPGAPRAIAKLDVPLDVRNRISYFVIEGQRTAGGTYLLDSGWVRRPVGLVGDAAELDQHSLLSGLYYLDRALKPYADLHIAPLDKLIKDGMAVIVLTDDAPLSTDDVSTVAAWIKHGGILVRFAGERLASGHAESEDEILPVNLRVDSRALGGALSWAAPQKLRAFPSLSPFHGLAVPEDVAVSRQILAEPSAALEQNTWADLADGTPLVTAKTLGSGLTVLFHVPANSGWSNLPLSGLFVDMLRRMVDLSHGVSGKEDFATLPPLKALDGFGVLQKPGAAASALSADNLHLQPSHAHPPGLYGTDNFNRALNLGPAIAPPLALSGVPTESYVQNGSMIELGPWCLLTALLLLLIDFLVSLHLRGLLALRAPTLVLLFFIAFTAQAQADDKTAIDLTSKTMLAYVRTGDAQTDKTSEAGLNTLARVLQRRTSIDQIAIAGVDPNRDELAFYPLLYWPIIASEAPLSPEGAARVNDYLRHGGMILFDTLTGDAASPEIMRHALAGITLPPLEKLPENHVLQHSFYLLDTFVGKYAATDFWIEAGDSAAHDSVATVLVGENNWAAAWATDAHGNFLFPCAPNGEAQRERAFRFGVNLVMYALTGNYKSDQLHAEALLRKLGK